MLKIVKPVSLMLLSATLCSGEANICYRQYRHSNSFSDFFYSVGSNRTKNQNKITDQTDKDKDYISCNVSNFTMGFLQV